MGWYAQKSLTLDPAQAAALPGLLPPAAATAPPLSAPLPATRPAVAGEVVAGGAVPTPAAAPRDRPRVERDGNAIRLRFE